ncbi:MAG: TonB-dependent receptor [Phenylobacterium zucineum]|nr:MAG: TonB-dependent receptor [Phenylobacterium zucineum]
MSLIYALTQAVVATAPDAAISQGVIAYPPAFFAAARPANAREMLDRVPGFVFNGGDGVRGYEGAAGNVLIDGQRPASKSDNLEDILRRLPASRVARVDLIRGGAPGIDMQGKAVIANIILKTDGGFHGLFAIADNIYPKDGRNAPATRLEGSGGSNGRNWELGLFAGSFIDDGSGDGPRLRVSPAGVALIRSTVQSEAGGHDYHITGAYETPQAGGKLKINGRLQRQFWDYDETNRTHYPNGDLNLSHQGDATTEGELGLRYTRQIGPATSLELVGLQRAKTEDFDAVSRRSQGKDAFRQGSDTRESIGRAVVKMTNSPTLSLEFGGEDVLNTLENRLSFVSNDQAIPIPGGNVRVEEKRYEVFGKAVWRPLPHWTVEGSLRHESSQISSRGEVNLKKTLAYDKPRIAVTWAPNGTTQVRLNIERSVGQLDFGDFTAGSSQNSGLVTAGNPNLVPEQAWVSEVALEQRFLTDGSVSISLRHSALTDVIDRAPIYTATESFDSPANIGDGIKDELSVELTLPFDRIGMTGAQLRGSSTWRRSEVTDPTTHTRREISGLRPLEWEAHFSWDLPQYKLNWGVDVNGAWRRTFYRLDEIEVSKLKTYVQPYIEWKPKPDLSIRGELSNATARGFRNTRYIYSGPRNRNGLAYTEDRDIQFGQMFYVRIRKTFG